MNFLKAKDVITKTNLSQETDAANKIQSVCRDYQIRDTMKEKSMIPPPAMQLTREEKAAIQIQVIWLTKL